MSALAARDNLSLLEVMKTGDPGLKPGSAARAFYHETVLAAFQNPTQRNAFLNNAWNMWSPQFSNPREWDSYTDKLAVRRTEWGATTIVVDAHGIPGAVQAQPNDAQNDLRLRKFRPPYRQTPIGLSRDEYIPITVDPVQVGRLMAESASSDSASRFMANQLTQVLNTDRAREFNQLMDSFARFVARTGIFYSHTADLDPSTITSSEAIAAAVAIRAAVLNLADFTNLYSSAKHVQNVPASQVRLVISVSAHEALGIGYGTAFNPEHVFALPADQIVVIPDQYFLSRPEFNGNQIQWALVDAGTDQGDGGTFVVVDSLYEQGADPFVITGTQNIALHHASFLDVNPFKTLIVGGPGAGTQRIEEIPVPATIALDIYDDNGIIAPGGGLRLGVEFSTLVAVKSAEGDAAGGYVVTITGANSPSNGTGMLRYSNGKVAIDDLATSITVTATSTEDATITVSHTYDLVGDPVSVQSGERIVNPITFPGVFAAGSGTGGTYTYTAATGVTYEKTLDGGATWAALGSSPVAVAHLATITVRATAASGYTFADGSGVKTDGPHTAA